MLLPGHLRVRIDLFLATFLSMALTSSPALTVQKWFILASTGDLSAKQFATSKHAMYSALSFESTEEIESFFECNLPEINCALALEGARCYFSEKAEKWQHRATLEGRAALDYVCAQLRHKALRNYEPRTQEEWREVLVQTCDRMFSLHAQVYAKKAFEKALVCGRLMLAPEKELALEGIAKLLHVMTFSTKVLQLMHLQNESKRLVILNHNLLNKIHALMGIEPSDIGMECTTTPVIALFETDSKKDFDYVSKVGFGEPLVLPPFKKGGALTKEDVPWAHADQMVSLVLHSSPKFSCHVYNCAADIYDPFDESTINHYANRELVSNPVVFNFSILWSGFYIFLRKTEDGIKFDENLDDYRKIPEIAATGKKKLAEQFPEADCEAPLDAEMLLFLEKEAEAFTQKKWHLLKDLVAGPSGEETHLVVSASTNNSGPLEKEGFHQATIKFLEDEVVREHALVALDYDFTRDALADTTHTAGEYKDIVLVVPATFVSCLDDNEGCPYFFRGGNSSASALLSAVAGHVRARFPALNHRQIKAALLDGANRDFPGYSEEVHGRGMVNLKGALQEAQRICSKED